MTHKPKRRRGPRQHRPTHERIKDDFKWQARKKPGPKPTFKDRRPAYFQIEREMHAWVKANHAKCGYNYESDFYRDAVARLRRHWEENGHTE